MPSYTEELCYHGIDLEIEFTYFKGCKGHRDSLNGVRGAGPPLEPDEPELIEIETIYCNEVDITEDFIKHNPCVIDDLEEKLWDLKHQREYDGQ